jgi:[protein-PII] uridylyltransferase
MVGTNPSTDALRQRLDDIQKTSSSADYSALRRECLREFLAESWDAIRAEHDKGESGLLITQSLTARMDGLVRMLYDEACEAARKKGEPPTQGYAVIALGGYGRGALNPLSDVDLLFLFQQVSKADPITRSMLHTLWDLRLDLGYSTRSIADCVAAAREDTDSLTAMLEARFLSGDRALARQLETTLEKQFSRRQSRNFVNAKIQERLLRHARGGLSVQLLEPNIKESPGGLRDTHTVSWLLKIRRGVRAPDGLRSERLLNRRSYAHFTEAHDFMLRTRNELHFQTGKRQDVLEHDLQPGIASALGYRDTDEELGVERFMRDYYLHARNIKHLSDLLCERLRWKSSVADGALDLIVSRTLDDGAVLSHTRITLPRKRKDFFNEKPLRLLSLFLDGQRFGARINEAGQQAIKDHLHLIDDAYRKSPAAARIFLDILRSPAGVAPTLHLMHELGVLGAYIPEFDGLTCLVQYNRYHVYTADQHTLVALENLEKVTAGAQEDPALRPLATVFSEIPRRDVLYLALLLHDVGKSARGEDHSEVGAEMSETLLPRLGLSKDQIAKIVFLVRHHLNMSHISQRRDLSDTSMLAEFAASFDDPDTLRMLYLLTYADLSAVTRTAWTAWKGQLLWDLYLKTFHLITTGGRTDAGDARREAARNLMASLQERFDRTQLHEHLSNMPPEYAEACSPDEVARHLDMAERLQECSVTVGAVRSGLFSEITVCTRDKNYRLSEICGVLATSDINIFSAQAYTRRDGVVIDTFQVTDVSGKPDIDPGRIQKTEAQLTDVFEERSKVTDLFERHQARWSRRRRPTMRIPTEVRIENAISDRYTVIDIFTQDEVGLLYKITRSLSDVGLDIYTARIGTQADKAVDSFYVSRKGRKLDSPDDMSHVRSVLELEIELKKT